MVVNINESLNKNGYEKKAFYEHPVARSVVAAYVGGSNLSEDDEVEIAITPAEGQVPTATINGSSIELTEDNGVYTGSFAMPGQASTLVISTGTSDEGGDGGEGLDKD